MPPYQFSPYHNPQATNTITSLIERQGEIPANAAVASGQAWGNAATQIAQVASQIPQDIRRERLTKLEEQKTAADLAQRQQQIDDQKALDAAFATPGGRDVVLSKIPGHLRPAVLKQLQEADTAAANIKKVQGELKSAQSDYLGGLGYAIAQHKYDPASASLTLAHARGTYADDPAMLSQIDQVASQLADNPESLKTIADGLIAASPKYAALSETATKDAATAEATRKRDEATAANATADNARADQALTADTAYKNRMAGAAEKRANAAQTAAAPLQGGATVESRVPVGQVDEDYLKTLPAELAGKVKAVAEGRLSLPSRFSKGDTYWEGVMNATVRYDPSFDATLYNSRSTTRKDLTSPSGVGGRTVNALNTAIQHAGKLSDLIEALDNTEYPMVNAGMNMLRTASGSTKVTNFKAVAPQLMKEIERAWRGTGGSTADIKDLIDSIGQNLGRQQQREALANFVELVQGKLTATEQQRDNAMGPVFGKTIPVLFDQSKPIMDMIQERASTNGTQVHGPNITASAPMTVGKYTVTVK